MPASVLLIALGGSFIGELNDWRREIGNRDGVGDGLFGHREAIA